MGWLQRCYEAYERNLPAVGKPTVRRGKYEPPMLLPVAHTTQKVHAEISLSGNGDFCSARVLRPDEMTTVIPCTEESSARTSGAVPHPLVDKLQYIAGDYEARGGPRKSEWNAYLAQLHAWCDSPQAHPAIRAVLWYIEKGCLIEDLVRSGVLIADESGRLLDKWTGEKEEMPPIFRNLNSADQFETFVRFRVDGDLLSEDRTVWDSFTQYYLAQLTSVDWCYAQGEKMPVSLLSPYKIRNAGDRAKLISSNDSQNFTYRGRFCNAQQALSIGYETTQKAHSALRWMIGRQGAQNGDQTLLVWGTQDEPVPPLEADTLDLVARGQDDLEDFYEQEPAPEQAQIQTRQAFAQRFNKVAQGYGAKLDAHSKISVMVLDSATPGRLSVRYYRELSGSRLLANVLDWHRSFAWELRYRKTETQKNGKSVFQSIVFWGAPAPADIARAAYGEGVDAKLKQQTIERLLPCITEGKPLPLELMRSAVRRASHGAAMEPWEARKTRSIACALVRGYYHRTRQEDYTMAVNENCNDRSYLFGRILACADQLESWALYDKETKSVSRPTNALRLEAAFALHPAKTTALLRSKLLPYLERLIKAGKSDYANRLMLGLMDRIPPEQFNDQPLSELYLLGYASQRAAFFEKNQAAEETAENTDAEETVE